MDAAASSLAPQPAADAAASSPAAARPRDQHGLAKRRWGLAILVGVVFLWTASSELTQALYGPAGGGTTALSLTYYTNSLFALYLPVAALERLIASAWLGPRRKRGRNGGRAEAPSAGGRGGGAAAAGWADLRAAVRAGLLLAPLWLAAQVASPSEAGR